MRQILCPIDFSDFSRRAFQYALAIARWQDATVHVLHVLPAPAGAGVVPFGPEGPGGFVLPAVDREHTFRDMHRFLAPERAGGVRVELHVAEGLVPHTEIGVQAERLSADLVVMGTHGRSGFDRLLLGSVTEKTVRAVGTPVLTIPAAAPPVTPPGAPPFQRILCAVDFSASSLAALRLAGGLAAGSPARLTALHVVERLPVAYEPMAAPPFDLSQYHAAAEAAAREHLQRFVPESLRATCDVHEVVVTGRPYAEILGLAAARLSDLVVLGEHGHHALERLLLGSTASQVIRRAECPVLTVRTETGTRNRDTRSERGTRTGRLTGDGGAPNGPGGWGPGPAAGGPT